ncbi:ABC transporter permease [Streptomyces sp. ISL-100]|uniref:ABC transporter permease n=1 Tax=Streptomyces sp. ISL-100 TaxID=2819173 RepID=UPI0027E3E53C|nr:ABC transporter permease [Streptomyces sp. ISL-100]
MLIVALSTLRSRWATFSGSFVALAIGVSLTTIMGLGLASTLDPPERAPERFAASPVVVMGMDRLTVEVERGPGTAWVSKKLEHPGLVDARLVGELRKLGPVVVDSAGDAVDAVGVDAPVEAVRRVAGERARVLTGDERRLADPWVEQDAEALVAVNSALGTAGGITTFVSVFVVASTFAFAVAVRRREFGLLRTAGATPGQLRRLLLTEAAVVGVLAGGAGCQLGVWGAPRLARAMVDGGLAPEWFAIGDESWPLHAAFWTGLLVALAGAWAASWRAGRIGPAEALRESSVDSAAMPLGRRLLGYGLLLAGVGLLVWSLATDPSDLLKRKTYTTQPMVLIVAVALLAPLLVRPVARALPLPGAIGMLVRENTAASLRRTAAIAAPVLITVALAGSLLGSAETITASKAGEARARTAADLVVTGDRGGLRVGGGRVAGATLSPSASTAVYVREERSALIRSDARAVTDPAALAEVGRLPVVAGDVRDLDDRSIVVNEEWERPVVGRQVDVWLGDGRAVTLRIVAVLAEGTGDNGAYVTAANAPSAPVDRIDVKLLEGAEAGAVAAALGSMTGGQVATVDDWLAASHPRTSSTTRNGLWLVLGIALVYTAIALANTLLMANSARSAELSSLRLSGATRAQVLWVVAGESLFAVAIGAVLGAAVSAVSLAGVGAALGGLSVRVVVAVPWVEVGLATGACAVVAALAGVLTCPWARADR